jgi:hypothetical protein
MFDKLEPNAATGPLDQSHGHSCSGNKDTSAVLILIHQEGHLQYNTYYITIRIITYGIYQNMVYSRINRFSNTWTKNSTGTVPAFLWVQYEKNAGQHKQLDENMYEWGEVGGVTRGGDPCTGQPHTRSTAPSQGWSPPIIQIQIQNIKQGW